MCVAQRPDRCRVGYRQGSLANYLAAATAAGWTHSEAQALDDAALNARLHPQRYVYAQFAVPDLLPQQL